MTVQTGLWQPPKAARVKPPPNRLRITPTAALAVIAVGTVVVLGMWWNDTPGIVGFGGWLTEAGRVTGLLAGYAIVIVLALMARIPALERGVGTDRLARWHAMGGRYVISLCVAHTLLIIWGYAVNARTGVFAQTGNLLAHYPDVLMATVSLGLLVVVGVLSARAVRRRVRYETWHFIHLYTYLAVALAFAHQFATGASFAFSLPARLFWSALYAIVGALLLWYRFLEPLYRTARHRLRVVAVVPETKGVLSVHISGQHLEELAADPGQFFRWRFLTRDLWWSANPYSLSAAPTPGLLRITVRAVGDHSAALWSLPPGTRVLAEGPYGGFTAALRSRQRVLLIAGGVGIGPVRALLDSLPGRPGDITLIYRSSSPKDLPLRHELDEMAARTGMQVHYVVGSRRSKQAAWLTAANLPKLVPGLADHDVFLCGPEGLVSKVLPELRAAGVPPRCIHHETFTF